MSCRLIALDMDGTLLMTDKSVHPDTVRDIEQASGRGIHVVYCSGRAVPEILPYVSRLKTMRYAVCMSGALVYDFEESRHIYHKAIAYEYVQKIINAAKQDDAMVQFLTDRASVVRADQVIHMHDFHMGVYQRMFIEITSKVPDMEEEAKHYASIPKVNVYFRSVQDRAEAYEALKHLPLSFAFAEGASLEMNAAGVTKASGLQALASHLGIAMTETVAIGDADNDRAMLEAAGLSVAMGNAAKDIRELCDAVTADNDHNGVGEAIRRYCL